MLDKGESLDVGCSMLVTLQRLTATATVLILGASVLPARAGIDHDYYKLILGDTIPRQDLGTESGLYTSQQTLRSGKVQIIYSEFTRKTSVKTQFLINSVPLAATGSPLSFTTTATGPLSSGNLTSPETFATSAVNGTSSIQVDRHGFNATYSGSLGWRLRQQVGGAFQDFQRQLLVAGEAGLGVSFQKVFEKRIPAYGEILQVSPEPGAELNQRPGIDPITLKFRVKGVGGDRASVLVNNVIAGSKAVNSDNQAFTIVIPGRLLKRGSNLVKIRTRDAVAKEDTAIDLFEYDVKKAAK